MIPTTKKVFMFFGEAISATDATGYPAGERHRIAGFGRGTELEAAAEAAAEHFRSAGWKHVAFESGEELLGARLANADEDIRKTVQACRTEGASGIVFKEQVPRT